MQSKRCPKCKVIKSALEFGPRSKCPGKLNSYCIPCNREKGRLSAQRHKIERQAYKYRVRYGITLAEYQTRLAEQNNQCQICERIKKLVVDHNHQTKEIRGLLCDRCNKGLGHFEERPELLSRAIQYLWGTLSERTDRLGY